MEWKASPIPPSPYHRQFHSTRADGSFFGASPSARGETRGGNEGGSVKNRVAADPDSSREADV